MANDKREAVFRMGLFRLAHGRLTSWKTCCEAYTDEDWATFAYLAHKLLPPFGEVEGVPTGGLKFAEALRRYSTGGPLLIAEDVVTTGGSMEKVRKGRKALGIAVYQRGTKKPDWVTTVLSFNPALFDENLKLEFKNE